jgi:hypothetical protein
MKDLKKKQFWIFLFVLSFGMISCSENGESDPDLLSIPQIENIMISGNWRITKFIDSGKDETNHFTGYDFIFNENGVLTSNNGANTYEGIWSISDSNSSDDSPDDMDFNILFNLTNDFEDLNDDWDILSVTSSKIELVDVSGGNGGTDFLTFEKN